MDNKSLILSRLVYAAIVILALALLALLATLPSQSLSANPVYMKF